jgi:hypothetical protein
MISFTCNVCVAVGVNTPAHLVIIKVRCAMRTRVPVPGKNTE